MSDRPPNVVNGDARDVSSPPQPLMPTPASPTAQLKAERAARSDADLVLIGTPIDLRRLIELDKPALRVTYKLQELGEPTLADVLAEKGLIPQPAAV